MFQRILHANDGSDNAFKALDTALALAALCGARLDVIFVEELSPRSGTIGEVAERKTAEDRRLRQSRQRVKQVAEQHGVPVQFHVFVGHPVEQILQFARDSSADLLVIGATQHAALSELIFGRRSDRLTHRANCSVLIAR